MSDNPYAATQFDGTVTPDHAATFYVVAPWKMAVLYVATLGLYGVYWAYKHWSNYKDSQPFGSTGVSVWPVARGIFAVFFIHALYREAKAKGAGNALVAGWNDTVQATILVILMLASTTLNRLSYRSVGSPTTDILSLLILVPLALMMMSGQARINAACGDPTGERNRRFTGANIAWLVVGALLWALAIFGLVAGE